MDVRSSISSDQKHAIPDSTPVFCFAAFLSAKQPVARLLGCFLFETFTSKLAAQPEDKIKKLKQ
jgi:hypothetical protein